MASEKLKCVFCKDSNGKIISFVEDKLKKCKEVLQIRVNFKLKYDSVQLPEQINDTDGYHRNCYNSFTALMAKYRNLSEINFSSTVDLPSTSNSTSISTTADVSKTLSDNTSQNSHTEVNIQEIDTSNAFIELDTEVNTSKSNSNIKRVCFFCGKDRKQSKGKQQTLHSSHDAKIYKKIAEWMTKLNNQELLDRIENLQSKSEIIFYHHSCELGYLNDYNKVIADNPQTPWHDNRSVHQRVFKKIESLIEEEVINSKNCLLLSSLCDTYNDELKLQSQSDVNLMTNHYLEEKVLKQFKKSIKIISKNKKKIIMHNECSLLEDNDLTRLEENELIDKAALLLRNTILKMDKLELPSKIKPRDLINGECTIPEKLDRFFKTLIGGKDIRRRNGVNCTRLCNSIASDTIFCVTNGTIKPSKHITLGMTVKSLTSSRRIINILNRLGHCCNYTTLEELETEATYSSVHRSEICPPDIIRKSSLCTGVAFDNFDRYVDTLNGKETLHDTVGIIYQNVDNDALDESVIASTSDQSDELPPPAKRRRTFEAIVPGLIPISARLQMLDRLTPVENIEQNIPSTWSLVQTIDLLHMVSLFLHVPNTPMWTGFNCRIIQDDTPKQKISYLTPINLSPTETSVIKLTMIQAKQVGVECDQKYVQVTYDLAIAKIALKIQSTEAPQFDNLFIHLGSFHLMMAFFKAIGVFINECGLSHMMVESKIIASGSVNGIIEGKHFNRCKRLHPLMAVGLQILHFDQFLKTKQVERDFLKEQIFDDLLQYQDLAVSHSTTTAELLPNQELSRLLSSYQKFVDKTRQGDHGKTAQFYMTYIQLVNYYVILSRSIRMGDFQMFKHIIPKITNLFFMVNQPNYARWCVKYYDNLQSVEETHPGLEEDFKSGCFGIKRTDKSFSRIPIDLTLEQTINADAAKRLSGIAHFTNSLAARQRWSKSHSIRAALISHVLDVCGLRCLQDITADLQPNRIKIFENQLALFIDILETNCNPFDPDLNKDELYNIATGKPVSEQIAEFLLNIEESGDALRKQFITECAVDGSRFDKPIKKNKILNFAEAPKKKINSRK